MTGPDLVAHATLTIADELDVARHSTFSASALRQVRGLIDDLAAHSPHAAALALRESALRPAHLVRPGSAAPSVEQYE